MTDPTAATPAAPAPAAGITPPDAPTAATPYAPAPTPATPYAPAPSGSAPGGSAPGGPAPGAPPPATYAPPHKPRPNILGRVGLILVLLAGLAPFVGFIYVLINGGWPGEQLGQELEGWSGVSGFFFAILVAAIAAPVAIIGLILGSVSLALKGKGKLPGILAIVLGILPSLYIFFWLLLKGITNQP